jgi:hypothetical protein
MMAVRLWQSYHKSFRSCYYFNFIESLAHGTDYWIKVRVHGYRGCYLVMSSYQQHDALPTAPTAGSKMSCICAPQTPNATLRVVKNLGLLHKLTGILDADLSYALTLLYRNRAW